MAVCERVCVCVLLRYDVRVSACRLINEYLQNTVTLASQHAPFCYTFDVSLASQPRGATNLH